MDEQQVPKSVENCIVIPTNDGSAVQYEDKIHTFNSTASEIFALCDGKLTVHEIIEYMQDRYPDEDIRTTVLDFLDRLRLSGLLVE